MIQYFTIKSKDLRTIFNSLFLLISNLSIITQIYLVTPLEPEISRGPKSPRFTVSVAFWWFDSLTCLWICTTWVQYQLGYASCCHFMALSVSKPGSNTFIIIVCIVLTWCFFLNKVMFHHIAKINWHTEYLEPDSLRVTGVLVGFWVSMMCCTWWELEGNMAYHAQMT